MDSQAGSVPKTRDFVFTVAGAAFGRRRAKMEKIQDYIDDATKEYSIGVKLVREPEKAHDPNAIKVLAWAEYDKEAAQISYYGSSIVSEGIVSEGTVTVKKNIGHIGYVPSEIAVELAPIMDAMDADENDSACMCCEFVSIDPVEESERTGKTVYGVKIFVTIEPKAAPSGVKPKPGCTPPLAAIIGLLMFSLSWAASASW